MQASLNNQIKRLQEAGLLWLILNGVAKFLLQKLNISTWEVHLKEKE